ncbi:MAG: DNA primase [Erysipelothrix sp.]|nr:DNA primase [Erysipelothrix sp.]
MARLQNEDINRVRQSADISEVISQYIPIEKKGRNFVAICPFHDDNNPSLTISPDKQIYKCFVCGAGGNVFTFVQNYNKVSFIEAVDTVAKSVNIDLNINTTQVNYNISDSQKEYFKITEDATNFLNFQLTNTSNQVLIDYLDKRKLTAKEIDYFNVGYEEDHSLVNFLKRKGYKDSDLVDINLVHDTDYGFRSVFNNRLVFPIHDRYQNVVGYSGRILFDDKDSAKYVNSNENVIYTKGDVLYNFHRAKDDAKREGESFLVEGVMDCIAFYQADVYNSVATLGTALTVNQASQIRTLAPKVVIAFDGDNAGKMATVKAIDVLLDHNLKIEVLVSFKNLDPDDFLKKYGKEEFNNKLKIRLSWMDFLIQYFNEKYNLDNFEERKEFTVTLAKFKSKIKDNFDQEYFLNKIAKITNFTASQISQLIPETKNIVSQPKLVKRRNRSLRNRVEYNIIGQMLTGKEAAFYIRDNLGYLTEDSLNRLYSLLIDYYFHNDEIVIADVISKINQEDEELSPLFLEIINSDNVIKEYDKEIIDENIGLIEVKLIERNIKDLRSKNTIDDSEKALQAKKIAELNLRKSEILEK